MTFFMLTMFVGILGTALTAKWLYSPLMPFYLKSVIFIVILLSWLAPVYVRTLAHSGILNDVYAGWVYNAGFYLFGTAFFLFSVLLIRNVVWYSCYGFFRILQNPIAERIDPSQSHLMNQANLITLSATLLISFYAVYEGIKVPDVKEVVLKSDKVTQPFTFVQLSDIHIHRGVRVNKIMHLVDKVNALNPDAVLLTGDIGDDDAEHSAYIAQKLAHLESRYGRFVVMGNHEGYRRYRHWGHLFESLGMKVLYNDGTSLGDSNIFIAGITDPSFAHWDKKMAPDIPKALEEALPTQYRILMSHSPLPYGKERIGDFSNLFDLQISGHTHGGQIFPFHFLVKMANEYLAGLYPQGKALIYVSRGTGYWGPPMRLFAPSEITLFKIIPDTI